MTYPPAGWYPDPSGAARQRYWDGMQWAAAPAVIVVPAMVTPAKDWAQRHPAWVTLFVFWIACMIWQWEWLAPAGAVAAAGAWGIRSIRRRNARLAADADRQNALAAKGDNRGIYGDYPPAAA
ncbi:hypothetical protein DE4576_05361 [Mycobacterium marinum]|uniref:DUF2510 domain-containing protein n=1 Tax=Mycobacterium marinum TaxID=1781 RepID=UPI000E3DDFFC|nr:DUF2510 domain-containing protein [Mycobacterium marinum]RFZ62050.1 hypothetical protein DE4576_05361 [Mycobacterium marinum]